ncbi:MAG TPA: CmpA/NrtA family ABC transporter substrate-binding protein [Chthoniobacterales bacterium]
MTSAAPKPTTRKVAPIRPSQGILRLGYVPLADAAPLLMAEALGLFQDSGLQVQLNRELGWGSIREKLVYGELDAAHAPAGMLYSILCGTHSPPCEVSTDLVLSLQGNAITLSRRLWEKGVRDGSTLRQLLRSEAPRKPAFAVVSAFSTHPFLLRKWLRDAGVNPDRDIRIVFLPPALVGEHMKAGQIDGFCVGEPWNSAATAAGDGWIVATSATLAPRHPEKVLLASHSLRHQRAEEYARLRQAIVTAAQYCDTPQGREELVGVLDSRRLFPVSREVLANSLLGPLEKGVGQKPEAGPLHYFFKNDTNRATVDRGVWLLDTLADSPSVNLTPPQRRAFLDAFEDHLQTSTPPPTTKTKK